MLGKLSSLELRPRETAALGFDADGPGLRRLLHTFGRITSTAKRPQAKVPSPVPATVPALCSQP